MPEMPAAPFHLEFTGPAREAMKALGREAKALGKLQIFFESALFIEKKLLSEPDQWGDPVFSLPSSHLPVYRGFYQMLQVEYLVLLDRRVVTIIGVRPMPRWGFSANP